MRARFSIRLAIVIVFPGVLASCERRPEARMARVEAAYEDARLLEDQVDVTRARGAMTTPHGVPLSDLAERHRAALIALRRELAARSLTGLGPDDQRALDSIRRTLEESQGKEADAAPSGPDSAALRNVECDYDPEALSRRPDGVKALAERMYACFGRAAEHLDFEGDSLDRLAVFGLLPLTDEPGRRQRLFLALAPVWASINRDNGPRSPYRHLVRLSAARMRAANTSVEAGAGALGMEPRHVEGWLVSILEAWREVSPEHTIEPWDFAYEAGRADRALRRAIPKNLLRQINDRFYTDLGADPAAIGVRYDVEPRDGKDPVAFTTFGARPRLRNGEWTTGEAWVFAAYSTGGIGNLAELLHETGHAVHIAAIRTRPAFMDWPDSDVFTEAIADLAALELFEPAWQARYLGASVPLADSLRAKYAGIVMDTAWALFEIRMHSDPERDPNQVWTEITERYLRIRPHPELSWWAMRGQLVDAPGYMLNYAVGAILIADIRARVKELRGASAAGDPTWYPWVCERLYRFGLERPSRRVVEEFLGRPISPRAILDDMRRAPPEQPFPLAGGPREPVEAAPEVGC